MMTFFEKSQQIDRRRRRQNKASPREAVAKIGHRLERRRRCYSPIPMGRKDHGGSDTTGRPQASTAQNSDKEESKVASRP